MNRPPLDKIFSKAVSLYLKQNFASKYIIRRKDGSSACGHLEGGLKAVLMQV